MEVQPPVLFEDNDNGDPLDPEKRIILLLDDEQRCLEPLAALFLAEGFHVLAVTSYDEAVKAIHDFTKDNDIVAIVDVNLNEPGKDGIAFLKYVQRTVPHRVMSIVLTADQSLELQNRALSAGAIFVLEKPVLRLDKLISHARYSQVPDLIRFSMSDAMTGLLKYDPTLVERGAREMNSIRSRQFPPNLSVIYIDGDHFKKINDTFGHGVGDQVIKLTAKIIDANVRKEDYASHKSGDEFIILTSVTSEIARQRALQIQAAVNNASLLDDKGRPIPFSVTAGVGSMHWEEITEDFQASWKELVRRADADLFEAKKSRGIKGR